MEPNRTDLTKEEPDFDKWKAYQDDQTAPMRESHKFIIERAREYPPFTPHGLNQLPYALMPAVAICMETYSEQKTKPLLERIEGFKWKQLSDDHNKYELFDLTDEQREKLKGEYFPGCKATIYWHFKDDGHNFKLKDTGYCFDLPGMAGDYYDDFFIHIPIPDGQEKEANEPVWIHVNCLLSNKDCTKVVLNTKS